MGIFRIIKNGLSKTRKSIASGLDYIFNGFTHIDDDFYEEIEEILIMADIGVETTGEIMESLKEKVEEQKIKQPADCRQLLIDSIKEQMHVPDNAYEFENTKSVVLMIGVNGVGKTTTCGKLAANLKNEGKKTILCAADTFSTSIRCIR